MGTLYLVRHGQASFGADDYDQLSPLGLRQSVRLGEHFREHRLRFDAVIAGTLRRHAQTWAGIAQGLDVDAQSLDARVGLNEYDSAALIEALHVNPTEPPTTPDGYRQHFRWLREALRQWMAGVLTPRGMPSYEAFVEGITSTLDEIREAHDGNVLIVSSGGPIATAVGRLLGTTPETTIELNLQMRNTSVTEFFFNPKRHTLVSFNGLPHLSAPALQDWITHA